MDYSKFILLGLIAIAGTGNGFVISQNRTDGKIKIEGGDVICIDKAPYQVYLKDAEGYKCGGALIRPNIVLTAAHCLIHFIEPLFIVAGTDSSKLEKNEAKVPGSVSIRVEKVIRHPKFDIKAKRDSLKYDIAIMKLERDFPETQRISPIELTIVDVKEGDELLVTGIGMVEKNKLNVSPCLKAYKPKVVNCEDASSSFKIPIDNYGNICHKSPLGHTTRKGDSGSPMVNSEGQLVGIHIISFKNDVCQAGINVHYHSDWIKQTIRWYTNEIL